MYYDTQYPWDELLVLLTGSKEGPLEGIDIMVERSGQSPVRHAEFRDRAQLMRTARFPGPHVTTLHAGVSGRDDPNDARPVYLVFDLDFRDQWKPKKSTPGVPTLPPLPLFKLCEHIQRPGATEAEQRDVCANCWRVARAGAVILRKVLCEWMGLPPPLYVYSGGNGMHVWFRLPPDSALRQRQPQELFVQRFLTRAAVLRLDPITTELRRLQLLDAAPNKFDVGPTLAAPRHRLTDRMDAAHAHMIKLPFSLHQSTRRPAIALGVDAEGLPLLPEIMRATPADSLAAYRTFLGLAS